MTYQPHHSEDATLKPVAAETDAPLPTKEAPDVYCPCEPHPSGVVVPDVETFRTDTPTDESKAKD